MDVLRVLKAVTMGLAWGCHAPEPVTPGGDSVEEMTGAGDDGAGTDDDTGEGGSATGDSGWVPDEVEYLGDSQHPLFTLDRIHRIELIVDNEYILALNDEPYEYVPAEVVVDGQTITEVGLRMRGKIGSFQYMNGKPKLRVDLNRYVPDQRYHGLESLTLNNAVVDCSQMKEVVAAQIFDALGVPASRASFVDLTINDNPYGLYNLVETQDDRFLKRVYADPDGNFYDGKYYWEGGYNFTTLDFGLDRDTLFQLDEGTDVEHVDVIAISEALLASHGTEDFDETLDPFIDWEAVLKMFVGEQWTGQNDGYVLHQNNYRFYIDPTDGEAELVSTDLDFSFIPDREGHRSWTDIVGQLATGCLQDSSCTAAWRDEVAEAIELMADVDLATEVAVHRTLIAADVEADPRRDCSLSEATADQELVLDWVQTRADYLAEFWEL